MNTTNLKFAIFGVGGTGGVIGGYLANAGNDVTFLARGAHLAAMQKDGLTIHTNHRGDIRIKPCQAMLADDYHDTPDVLFICVKYYGLDAAIALTRRIAGPDTLVIPILNVFGTGAVMQEKLPGKTVLDGCIYVFAKRGGPGIIEQPQEILRVFYGFYIPLKRLLKSPLYIVRFPLRLNKEDANFAIASLRPMPEQITS